MIITFLIIIVIWSRFRLSLPWSTLLLFSNSQQSTKECTTKINSHQLQGNKERAMPKGKERRRTDWRTMLSFFGVIKRDERFLARIKIDGKDQYLPWHVRHIQGSCRCVQSCCHPRRTSNIQSELSWSSSQEYERKKNWSNNTTGYSRGVHVIWIFLSCMTVVCVVESTRGASGGCAVMVEMDRIILWPSEEDCPTVQTPWPIHKSTSSIQILMKLILHYFSLSSGGCL